MDEKEADGISSIWDLLLVQPHLNLVLSPGFLYIEVNCTTGWITSSLVC